MAASSQKSARPSARGQPVAQPDARARARAAQPAPPSPREAEGLEAPAELLKCPFCPLRLRGESKHTAHAAGHIRQMKQPQSGSRSGSEEGSLFSSEDLDVRGDLAGLRVNNEIMAQTVRTLNLQRQLSGGNGGPDPRDERIRGLEAALFQMQQAQRDERLLAEMRAQRADIEALKSRQIEKGRPEDGHDSLSNVIVGKLVDKAFGQPDPFTIAERAADVSKKLAEARGASNATDLELARINAKVGMWQSDRQDARADAIARAHAEAGERERGREEFHDLVLLGKDALEKALQPITVAVGDGLRERVAGRGSLPPAAPAAAPPAAPMPAQLYANIPPEKRAIARAQLNQMRADIAEHERALNDAESHSAPVPGPPAVPVERPYGDYDYGVPPAYFQSPLEGRPISPEERAALEGVLEDSR